MLANSLILQLLMTYLSMLQLSICLIAVNFCFLFCDGHNLEAETNFAQRRCTHLQHGSL